MRRTYTKELLEEAVANSFSFAGVLRYLNLRQAGGTQSHIARMVRKFDIDHSHFTGRAHNKGVTSLNKKKAEDFLVLGSELAPRTKRDRLLRSMLEMGVPYKCAECGQDPEWNGKTLVLDIDHINGNFWDNRLENLRFLCPNCHSQQEDTNKPRKYRGVEPSAVEATEVRVTRPELEPKRVSCVFCGQTCASHLYWHRHCLTCVECGEKSSSLRCKPCNNKQLNRTNKIKWPEDSELLDRLSKSNYSRLGRELGVSDNAIRKRVQSIRARGFVA